MRRSGELERAVMEVLWNAGKPCTAKDVLATLPDQGLAHTTVITVLGRLARKGVALRERSGRSWQYVPAASRESYVSSLMMDVLGQAANREAVLAHFAKAVTGPDADVLRNALTDSADVSDDQDSGEESGP
ncbi:BlaI/MecI/CopY family transcriptional regulator [Streptomyces buecherae]|uniref:BlaI/MecI/CopY family transcriptional regulator n=1 Tax=Streptomyces buecherae TaxID=2763006 RepID=UPI003694CA97